MAGIRSNSQIVKGSMLMAFIDDAPVGFATSHSLNITTNTTEVSTKDHGDYPSVIAQSIGWEVTAENFYSDGGEGVYMQAQLTKTPVTIKFAKAGNYSTTDEKGVIGTAGHGEWTVGSVIASGQALVTSFSVNAPSGDNATMSVTFTGIGPLDQQSDSSNSSNGDDNSSGDPSQGAGGTSGTQGVQGPQGEG